MSQLGDFLHYKARLSGGQVIEVDPRNTSRRCSSCGHVTQENRESQAVFLCKKCGHEDNADHTMLLSTFWTGRFGITGKRLLAFGVGSTPR